MVYLRILGQHEVFFLIIISIATMSINNHDVQCMPINILKEYDWK